MRAGRRVALPRTVVLLGVVSLLTDASSEMIVPLLPAFLAGLGGGALALGLIEGTADATASILKLLAGRWSDRSGRRRPWILGGYAVSSVVRPLVALAAAAWHVLVVRVVDRVGKGLRTSPRDAMIAASVPAQVRGAAFGFHRALDHAGAVVGALAATTVLLWVSTNPRMVFGLAAVPAAAAVLVLSLGLRERPVPAAPPHDPTPRGPAGSLPRLLVPIALFTLGNGSEVFLLFKAHAARIPLAAAPLLWMGLHVVKALTSLAGGSLADRIGRRRTLALGWMLHAAVYAGLAFAERPVLVAALFLAHGLYSGLGESAERALVADLVPRARWGGGYGWYHLVAGALTLAASVLFGAVWEIAGSRAAFLLGAAVTLAALGLLALLAAGNGRRGPG